MIKYTLPGRPHPLETPFTYTQQEFNDICTALKIEDKKHREIFLFNIEDAALHLINNQKRYFNTVTKKQNDNDLKRLYNSIEKTRQLYSKAVTNSYRYSFRFSNGLSDLETEAIEIKQLLRELIHDGYILKLDRIDQFLEVLGDAVNNSIKQNTPFTGKNKTDLVIRWILDTEENWYIFSSVLISEGRQNYLSPSMNVFEKLITPLNKRLKQTDNTFPISLSMVSEAIKELRKREWINKASDLDIDLYSG